MIKTLLNNGANVYPICTDVQDNEFISNTAIINYKDKLVTNIRTITYLPLTWKIEEHKSSNYIGIFNGYNNISTTILPWNEGEGKIWGCFSGREDIRFVVWNDKLYGYATRTDIEDNKAFIELMEFDDDLNIVKSTIINRYIDIEKNWMAVPDKPFTFIWWNDPITIITVDPDSGEIKSRETKDIYLGEISGSTSLIEYKNKYVGLVHQSGENGYQEAFVIYSKNFETATIGNWFKFNTDITEFITGLTIYKENVYLSLSLNDIIPLILEVPLDVFDMWVEGKLVEGAPINITSPTSISYKYIGKDNKRALALLSIHYPIEYFIFTYWLAKHNMCGLYIRDGLLAQIIYYMDRYEDSADKYYLLYMVTGDQENIIKAKQYGMPSAFFTKLFNEHYIK